MSRGGHNSTCVKRSFLKGILLGTSLLVLGLSLPKGAQAQFVCDSTTPGGAAGAVATGTGSFACGTNAGTGAAATNTFNTAIGAGAGQNVAGSGNIAVGDGAVGQNVTGHDNLATGSSAGLRVTGNGNSAYGVQAGQLVTGNNNITTGTIAGSTVTGDGNIAIGRAAGRNVMGDSNVAFGFNAGINITASNTISIGNTANAGGNDAVAIGRNSTAAFTNSTAIGQGATTTRANQQMFGTAANTYTMPGITSAASQAAQSGPLSVVTSDVGGNLSAGSPASLGLATSADIANINNQIGTINNQISGLQQRDKELASGIAISMALAQPILLSSQSFGLRVGWGNFDGSNALGMSGAGVLNRGYAGPTSSVVLDAGIGVGTDVNMVAGRAGLTFGW
jgi:hypothetical protein